MKRKIFLTLTLTCFCANLLCAEYTTLDSIRLTENFTLRQKVILHDVKVPNTIADSAVVMEFVYKGTLYIISSIFFQDPDEYMQEFPDLPSLVRMIMSTCSTECRDGDCGYTFTYDSGLPSTLTVYTFPNMDTIQYVATHSPRLHAAVIKDTIFSLSNIRCGISLKNILGNLFVGQLYYNDYIKYPNVVIEPADFDNRAYKKKGYMNLPNICFVLENKNGIINKIEVRQTDYFSNKRIIQDLEFY